MRLRVAIPLLVLTVTTIAQPRPYIDFNALLRAFPDLPWNFEIRYVVKDGRIADMLRIHYDGRSEVVRWRPEYAGSLASVCQGTIREGELRKLLEIMRDSNFNELPSESEGWMAVALQRQQIVSVRMNKTVVRKIDRGNLKSLDLKRIQDRLAALTTAITDERGATCRIESVPAPP